MKIKQSFYTVSLLTIFSLLPLAVMADDDDDRYHHRHNHYVKARVIDVTPIFERGHRYQEPVRTCYSDRSRYDADDRRNALIGSVVGGVIGYQIGDKPRHKRLGAVAGALIGSAVADSSRRSRAQTRCETHYETRYDRRRVSGYDVVYKYRGRHYTTFSDYRPGRWIEIERPRKYYGH